MKPYEANKAPAMRALKNRIIRWILMVMLLAGTVSACASVSRFEKDALTAYGEKLDGSCESLYYSILIDLGDAVDSSTLNTQLKLRSDAPPMPLSDLGPDVVAKYLPRFSPPPQWPEKWKKKAQEQDAYTGGGFHIVFKKTASYPSAYARTALEAGSIQLLGLQMGMHFIHSPLQNSSS
jgi:hypothetical protein